MSNGISKQHLIWQPLISSLISRFEEGEQLSLVVSPFIKIDALEELIRIANCKEKLQFIVRWRADDLLSGVSDLAIYPLLKKHGYPLYVCQQLHMKLYVYESNLALSTSSNLTQRGLGIGPKSNWNIECGSEVLLSRDDWYFLHQLIRDCRLVDDSVYERLEKYVSDNVRPNASAPSIVDIFTPIKIFTLASLPATANPTLLEEYYFSDASVVFDPELERRTSQDLITYKIKPGLLQSDFKSQLESGFLNSPFVLAFLTHLKKEKSLRFGAVTSWIHDHCEDVPLPYRSDIKIQVQNLYSWLNFYVPEIYSDRPRHSQIIYWKS